MYDGTEEVITMIDPTRSFSIRDDKEAQVKAILTEVYDALK